MLIDLAIHLEWRERCKKEVQDLLARHLDPSATLYERLVAVPLSAWEDELPILDACIRESHRTSISSLAVRRNVREEIRVCGRVVNQGDFLVYSQADVHLNPEYYPEPHRYDPGRWLRPDPIPNAIYPFLGWGAGRHPCPGVRAAKLKMKLILVLFLANYEFDLVDKDGKFPNPLPVPNRNDIHQVRAEFRIRYSIRISSCLFFSRPALLELRTTSISRRSRNRQAPAKYLRAPVPCGSGSLSSTVGYLYSGKNSCRRCVWIALEGINIGV